MARKKNFLDRRHPGYLDLADHWRFLQSTYEGGPRWMNEENLFKFHKEGKEEYKQRKARAFRDNISRDIVDVWTAHLFKAGVTRDEGKAPESVKAFIAKCTRGHNAMDLDKFMSMVCSKSSAAQVVWVIVDMPKLPAGVEPGSLTIESARALKLSPYVYAVYPTDVLDFGIDEDGELTWILIREYYRDDLDPLAVEGPVTVKYRLWDRDSWRLFVEADGDPGFKLESQGVHPCGRVPAVRVVHMEGEDIYHPVGLIDEIAYKDRTIANDESRLDCIICDQTFSTLWIPDKGLIASTERDAEGKRKKFIQAATNRAALFNDAASHIPFYLSPDSECAATIDARIKRLRIECWEDALMGVESRTKSEGPQTATEAEQKFEKLNAALADKASNLESAERSIISLAAAWSGDALSDEQLEVISKYPRKFNVQALIDALNETAAFQKFNQLGSKFWELALMEIVKRRFPEATEEELTAIRNEIVQNTDLNSMLAAGQEFQSNLEKAAQLPDDEEEEE